MGFYDMKLHFGFAVARKGTLIALKVFDVEMNLLDVSIELFYGDAADGARFVIRLGFNCFNVVIILNVIG